MVTDETSYTFVWEELYEGEPHVRQTVSKIKLNIKNSLLKER